MYAFQRLFLSPSFVFIRSMISVQTIAHVKMNYNVCCPWNYYGIKKKANEKREEKLIKNKQQSVCGMQNKYSKKSTILSLVLEWLLSRRFAFFLVKFDGCFLCQISVRMNCLVISVLVINFFLLFLSFVRSFRFDFWVFTTILCSGHTFLASYFIYSGKYCVIICICRLILL